MFGSSINTVDILDDAAQIDHMFCDKTGTLTKNELIFREMEVIGESRNVKAETQMIDLRNDE